MVLALLEIQVVMPRFSAQYLLPEVVQAATRTVVTKGQQVDLAAVAAHNSSPLRLVALTRALVEQEHQVKGLLVATQRHLLVVAAAAKVKPETLMELVLVGMVRKLQSKAHRLHWLVAVAADRFRLLLPQVARVVAGLAHTVRLPLLLVRRIQVEVEVEDHQMHLYPVLVAVQVA